MAGLVLSLRPSSNVARVLERIAPRGRSAARWDTVPDIDLRHSGLRLDPTRLLALRIASGCAGALLAGAIWLVLPLGPMLLLLAAYGGFIAPSLAVSARARMRREDAERAVTVLVERLEALVAAGRPPETAIALLMVRPSGSALLDRTFARASAAYALGAPIFRTLEAHAREDGLGSCASLARELERARDLGAGSLGIIRERRIAARAAERSRTIEAASQVEGKLMLVLVLCYLPALIVLVVIPLFIGLLEGLFA